MIKVRNIVIWTLSAISISCSDDSATRKHHMSTGFYFVTKEQDGVQMKIESRNETYSIAKTPFASVRNVSYTEIERANLKEGDYTELCMTFDSKGSKDIENGTGNTGQPKIAVIIDNKLLYVVENTTKITTGVMCVALTGYSDDEIIAMKRAVDQKK